MRAKRGRRTRIEDVQRAAAGCWSSNKGTPRGIRQVTQPASQHLIGFVGPACRGGFVKRASSAESRGWSGWSTVAAAEGGVIVSRLTIIFYKANYPQSVTCQDAGQAGPAHASGVSRRIRQAGLLSREPWLVRLVDRSRCRRVYSTKTKCAGAAADARERLKVTKYSCLDAQYHFFAFGVETLGPWGKGALELHRELSNRQRAAHPAVDCACQYRKREMRGRWAKPLGAERAAPAHCAVAAQHSFQPQPCMGCFKPPTKQVFALLAFPPLRVLHACETKQPDSY
ncbi:hypothetical protein MSG28_000507 [Choristoneura fumiferana]|uniref:Uncharacterized protein n=1 Tax=Choristoneura fumiferana TaxID=7141 RepID=A0ACC0K122_CHOFU|nr:hypothetical protein MSG28_000507 [Choristoneura fumiferana]